MDEIYQVTFLILSVIFSFVWGVFIYDSIKQGILMSLAITGIFLALLFF